MFPERMLVPERIAVLVLVKCHCCIRDAQTV